MADSPSTSRDTELSPDSGSASEAANGVPATTKEPPGQDPVRHGFARRNWGKLTILGLVTAPILFFTLWAGITLSFSYSDGTRTGFVQKLSHKGWVCKTWEGEMAMTAQPGVAPQIFHFSVRDDSVAAMITALEGRQVTVEYSEHRGVPTRCFGETGYFVKAVRAVRP